MDGYYKLNFIEKSYTIKKEIIKKIPYFSHLIEACEEEFKELDIPRMGFMFDHVLAYVTSPLYPYLQNITMN